MINILKKIKKMIKGGKKMGKNRSLRCFYSLIVLLIIVMALLPKNTTLADEDKYLFIVIHDNETNLPIQEEIFYEGKEYDIAVGCVGEYGYAYNVSINIPWENTYITSEELPWITVKTPSFEQYSDFVITASKNGFISVEQKIGVLKGKLSLSTDRGTVKEKGSFSVTVVDQNNNKLEGCMVYLDGYESKSDITGSNGIAYVSAPEVDENVQIDIKAFKAGYLAGSSTIRIENISPDFIPDGWYPILGSLIMVFSAILIVRLRKTRSAHKKQSHFKPSLAQNLTYKNKKMDFDRSVYLKNGHLSKRIENPLPLAKKGPWVEEIRIHRTDKKKETKLVGDNKPGKDNKKITSNSKKEDCDWFKGKKYMRYKIDELTGEIDDKNEGKWFEGIDDIKTKVDRRLRDNCKRAKQGE